MNSGIHRQEVACPIRNHIRAHHAACVVYAGIGALAMLDAGKALAVENGAVITPPGIFDFGTGNLPPPSDVGAFAVRAVTTHASKLRDAAGNVSPVGVTLRVNALVFAGLKTTNVDLLGGKYAFGAVLPMLDNRLDLTVPTPIGAQQFPESNRSAGDLQITPVMVQWKPTEGLFTHAGLMLQLPTGSYRKHRAINSGTNHWTVQPNFQFTYITRGGLEFSGSSQMNFNGKNRATQYRSGIEFLQDFGVGQHVGDWTFGVAGYVYRQITDDKAPALADGNRSRVNALGPAVGFFGANQKLPVVYLHIYKEFGARNRAEGTQAALRVSVAF